MGPTWVLSAPGGPHVGPMFLAIWVPYQSLIQPEEGNLAGPVEQVGKTDEGVRHLHVEE